MRHNATTTKPFVLQWINDFLNTVGTPIENGLPNQKICIMKTKMNSLFLVGMITASILANDVALAGEGDKKIENHRLSNRKEYKDMKRSMNNIEKDRERIVFHKAEFKKNKEAGLVIESHMSKKEIRKAKADLRRDKKYLRIDKRDLAADQWTAIKTQDQEKRQAKKELRVAKREVRKDLRKGDALEFKYDSARVQELYDKKELEKQQSVALKEDVYEFFVLLDEEIEEVV